MDRSDEGIREAFSKAGEMAEETKQRAQEFASSAAGKVKDLASKVGEQMRGFAGAVRERGPREGALGTATESMASGLENAGSYLEETDFRDVGAALTAVVRRYPVQSLLVGLGIGYLLARRLER